MVRLGGFPDPSSPDEQLLVESTTVGGFETVHKFLPPGPDRQRHLVEIRNAMTSNAARLPSLVDELRNIISGRDLVQLLNSVVVPASMVSLDEGEGLADGDRTSSWAAKIEYLVGVVLSIDPSGEADTPREITEKVLELVSAIFEADSARMITKELSNANGDEPERELLLQQLKMEYQSDRMPGYAVHLQRVDDEVFARHRNYYLKALGFCPADVIRITRKHARWANESLNSALSNMADLYNDADIDPEAAVLSLRQAFDAPTLWDPDVVAAHSGVAVEQVRAILDFFATKLHCQPDFRLPGDKNLARTHPVVELDDGRYLVPDPWAMSAALHNRLAVQQRPGYDRAKYHKHRQDAHERLILNSLQSVYGENACGSRHYLSPSGEVGEIDTLVLSEWPLVVEGKAISLTEAGRQGKARRVETKLAEILGKALDQTNRALSYILEEEGREFSPKPSSRAEKLLPDAVSGGTAVVVTFERMDPLAFSGPDVLDSVRRPTWVVSLTDMLMVADVLTTPGEFSHYAKRRGGMVGSKAMAASEADLLGAYLADRLCIIDRPSSNEFDRVIIGYSADELNEFYTSRELSLATEKPGTGVPADVADALAKTARAPGWAHCVDTVMLAQPTAWKKWKRFRNRHRRGGTFTYGDLSLAVVTHGEPSINFTAESITLHVPQRR